VTAAAQHSFSATHVAGTTEKQTKQKKASIKGVMENGPEPYPVFSLPLTLPHLLLQGSTGVYLPLL
jgi:hypothetical protein